MSKMWNCLEVNESDYNDLSPRLEISQKALRAYRVTVTLIFVVYFAMFAIYDGATYSESFMNFFRKALF